MTTTNKAVVRRLYDEVLNNDRPEVADEIADPAFTIHGGVPGRPTGPDALRAVGRMLRAGFPDLHFTLDDVVAENDRVAVRWTMTGTHAGQYLGTPPTGRRIELHAIVIFRLAKGRLAELWPQVDDTGLERQLAGAR